MVCKNEDTPLTQTLEGTRPLAEGIPRLEIAGQSPHSFPQLKAEKNVGKALSVTCSNYRSQSMWDSHNKP